MCNSGQDVLSKGIGVGYDKGRASTIAENINSIISKGIIKSFDEGFKLIGNN